MRYKINFPGENPVVIKENIYDKIVRYTNPVKAADRMRARFQLEMASESSRGGYQAGKRLRGKKNNWLGDADYDTLLGRDVAVSDSRHLYRNNAIAAGAIDSSCMNIVGTGLKPEARLDRKLLGLSDKVADELEDKIESEFNYYANSVECDITRSQNFWELQYLALLNTFQNGDVLGLFPYRERGDFPYGTKLQLVESDRISNKDNATDTETLIAGVQKNQWGETLGYWVANKHPGNRYYRNDLKWFYKKAFTPDGRQSAILVMHKTRPGQTRGVPYLANVLDSILTTGEYMQSEQKAALVSSLFTVFVKKTNPNTDLGLWQPDSESGGTASDDDYKMGSGSIVTMGTDEDISMANMNRPNPNFEGFIDSILTIIGMGVGIPKEFLTKKYNSNYTAARAAVLDAWRFFNYRRQWLVDKFCQPFYTNWMYEAVAKGYIEAPGFFTDPRIRAAYLKTEWIGEPMWHVDPLKEVNAQGRKIELGLSTKTKEARKLGNDYDTIINQRAKEKNKEYEAGLIETMPDNNNEDESINDEEVIDDAQNN